MKLDRAAVYWSVLAAATSLLPLVLLLRPSSQMLVAACFAIGATAALTGRRVPTLLRLALIGAAALTVFWLFGIGFGARTFGRDAGSVLLASMLGLKLFELATIRDGRSVASFSLFSLMSAFLQDQGPLTLLLSPLLGALSVDPALILPTLTKFVGGGTAMMGVFDDMLKSGEATTRSMNAAAGFLLHPLDIPGVAILISASKRVASVWRPAAIGAMAGILVRSIGHALLA